MKKYDNNKNRPGGVIVFPPGGGPGPVIFPPYLPKPKSNPFPPVPPLPQPENDKFKVKIKSVFANGFVVVGENGYLYVAEEKYSKNAVFKLIFDKNQIKIKHIDDSFVRVDERGFLIADTNKKGATVFNLYKVDKEQYVIQAPNGYYVRVRDKDNLLVAKAENAGPKTIFKFKMLD